MEYSKASPDTGKIDFSTDCDIWDLGFLREKFGE